jgi:hypothetical protein
MSDATISNARNAVIKFTGTITGNQIVTIPSGIEKTYTIFNGTTGAFTVEFKTASGTGPTFSTTDKGIKLVYSDGTNVVDILTGPLSNVTIGSNLSVNGGTIKLDGNYPVGTSNVALGDGALDDGSLTGGCNTAIGNNALTANTTGCRNTAINFNSLPSNTTGNGNTAVGETSLCANTEGSFNTAVGVGALLCNTCGCNTAIGAFSLACSTTAICNTAIGINSGCTITTGGCNTLVGKYLGCNSDLDIRTKCLFTVLSTGDGEPVFVTKTIAGATTFASYRLMKQRHGLGFLFTSGTIAASGNVAVNVNNAGGNGSIGILAVVTFPSDSSSGFDSTFMLAHNHGSGYNDYGTALLYTTVNSITIVRVGGTITVTNGSAKEIKYQFRYINLGAGILTLEGE